MARINIGATLNWNRRDSDEEKNQEWEQKISQLKAEFQVQIDKLKQENTSLRSENEGYKSNIKIYQSETVTLKRTITEYTQTITQYTERIKRVEQEQEEKTRRLREIEATLFETQHKLQAEMDDDVDMEAKIKNQQEVINTLTLQIEGWKQENARDDAKIAQLESQLKLKGDEIYILKKRIADIESRVPELEADLANADVAIQEVEDKYNTAISERDQLTATINLKLNIIREYEERISSLNSKISSISRSIEEYKIIIQQSEQKELDWKRLSSDFEVRLSTLKNESDIKTQKLTSVENIIKTRETRIVQLNDIIKEKDNRIKELNENLNNERNSINELKLVISEKIGEIAKVNQENQKDESKINELIVIINNQNETIKKWQEENDRDDSKIAELTAKLNKYEQVIAKLKEYIQILKGKFNEVRKQTKGLEILNETSRQQLASTEVTVEKYQKLEEEFVEKKDEIANLKAEIQGLTERINALIDEKQGHAAEIEKLTLLVKQEQEKAQTQHERVSEFEEKITSVTKRAETENSSYIVAQSKVSDYKEQVVANAGFVQELFHKIEVVLG